MNLHCRIIRIKKHYAHSEIFQDCMCSVTQNILTVKMVTTLSKSSVDVHCSENTLGMSLKVIKSSTQRKMKHIVHCFFLTRVSL